MRFMGGSLGGSGTAVPFSGHRSLIGKKCAVCRRQLTHGASVICARPPQESPGACNATGTTALVRRVSALGFRQPGEAGVGLQIAPPPGDVPTARERVGGVGSDV